MFSVYNLLYLRKKKIMTKKDLMPDKIGYYGKPVSSLTKDELVKVVLELSEIIYNCPVKGKCSEIITRIKNQS